MFATAAYLKHRQRAAARSRRISEAGREIGDLPPVENPARKARCRLRLRLFCEHYLGHQFPLAWAPFHLDLLAGLQRVTLGAGNLAYALPRGSGKTTLAKAAALWAVAYGHRRYTVIVAATTKDAAKLLKSLKRLIETSPSLAADFPEICYPIQCLAGINQKAAGQLHHGQPTGLAWKADAITLARIPGAASSEATIETVGITGALRGKQHALTTGQTIRPDLVLIDDPQTRKSAKSAAQTQARLDTLQADILGLAGPGQPIAAIAAATVIYPHDLADQLLDREAFPQWQGTRAGLVDQLPTGDLVSQYADILRAELATGHRDHPAATRFWRKHRRDIEAGTTATWPQRYHHGRELSAVQHAVNLWIDNPTGFWGEYQNDPARAAPATTTATRDQIAASTHPLPRAVLPEATQLVTAFIDCHLRAMYWAAVAHTPDGTAWLVDYGTWPDQRRQYFTLATCPRTIAHAYPDRADAAQLRAALDDCAGQLLGRTWKTEHGQELATDLCLVDTGWNYDVVQEAARQSPHRPRLQPSKGVPIGPARRPIAEWQRQPGDRLGPGWIWNRPARRLARQLQFDANHWKGQLHRALAKAAGDPGGLTFFTPGPRESHDLLTDHLQAETAVETYGHGRTVQVFTLKPDRPDNHWLDCLAGCLVAASFRGLGQPAAPATAKPRPKVAYLDV